MLRRRRCYGGGGVTVPPRHAAASHPQLPTYHKHFLPLSVLLLHEDLCFHSWWCVSLGKTQEKKEKKGAQPPVRHVQWT